MANDAHWFPFALYSRFGSWYLQNFFLSVSICFCISSLSFSIFSFSFIISSLSLFIFCRLAHDTSFILVVSTLVSCTDTMDTFDDVVDMFFFSSQWDSFVMATSKMDLLSLFTSGRCLPSSLVTFVAFDMLVDMSAVALKSVFLGC